MEIVPYGGWNRCLRLSDGRIEIIATLEVGPRVIRFGFVNGKNEFAEFPHQMGKVGGNEYRSYGGHRLWIAPEIPGRTDLPDNDSVTFTQEGDCAILTAPLEAQTGFQRELRIALRNHRVFVEHRIVQRMTFREEVAPWALSVMAPGGVGFFPQEPYQSHQERLLPVRPLVLWGYTDMSDSRWRWGKRLVRLKHAPIETPQKVGALVTAGWGGYVNENVLFLKRFPYIANARYPDFGCNFETFTRFDMLELESLGPLSVIEQDSYVSHEEVWGLWENFSLPDDDNEAIVALQKPIQELFS